MTWKEFIRKKNQDAYYRMFTEMLLIVFNDILSYEYYQYHVTNYLQNKDIKSKKKIEAHNEAIDWLLSDDDAKKLCFLVLRLDFLSKDDIMKAIVKKFTQAKKFNKFFFSYAEEVDAEKERECYRKTRKELS